MKNKNKNIDSYYGVIFSLGNINLICENVNFTNNYCGVIYSYYKNIDIDGTNIIFENNMGDYGGVIHAKNVDINSQNIKFNNNIANKYGGAIDVSDLNINSADIIFNNNNVIGGNGGAFIATNIIINGINILFENNSAMDGGAIYKSRVQYSSTTTIKGTNIFFI